MIDEITVEPMSEEFILWRCLHGGPLSRETVDRWPEDDGMPWAKYRARNEPLLRKLTQTYSACAIVARDGERIVGTLRFYPKAAIRSGDEGAYCCLQQGAPYGPPDDFAEVDFLPLAELADKTLVVHCMMTGNPQWKENKYQRKGLGTRLAWTLIDWARENGWERIEVDAFEDLPIVYEITGGAGIAFWEKLGFQIADRFPHPHLQEPSDFTTTLEEQAKSLGLDPERAKDRIIMRLDLRSNGQ